MTKQTKTCPTFVGTGMCQICGGKGQIGQIFGNGYDCPLCKRDGEEKADGKCSRCRGTGVVSKD